MMFEREPANQIQENLIALEEQQAPKSNVADLQSSFVLSKNFLG